MPTVFYTVLNMGLGHAARSLPIIREFLRRDWRVIIGSNGRALAFLKRELPDNIFVETPDYGIEYTKKKWLLLPALTWQGPRILGKIAEEQRFCQKIAADYQPDIIFSDHCYGAYHQTIPSYFLTHQIYFAMPPFLEKFAGLPAQFNFFFHKRFTKIIIPDAKGEDGGLLSGRLSRLPKNKNRYHYAGILSSTSLSESDEVVDILVSISGPEPQRTLLEKKILAQLPQLPGKKVVVLGKSESTALVKETVDLKIYNHVPRKQMSTLLNQAKLIISRPGYTTLMEVAEMGKKALFIPTPGQTEQEYLAKYCAENQWFYAVSQEAINLEKDCKIANEFPGRSLPNATEKTISKIFTKILEIGES